MTASSGVSLSSVARGHRCITRTIPATGEALAVMGMGTFITFDAGDDPARRANLARVLQAFFDNGGELIDTSPHYDSSGRVTGDLLQRVQDKDDLFTATKIRTDQGRQAGTEQMHGSLERLGVGVIDLLQIHNLVDWQTHIKTLYAARDAGTSRYIGVTTHRGRYHDELVEVMKKEDLDFVQFTYNVARREAEQTLFPVAADRGIATLINMPFQRGELFQRVRGRPLTDWAASIGCDSGAQVFLKYIISHPQTTCVIPATADAGHMRDNMQAGFGELPDAGLRRRIEREVAGA